MDNLENPFPFMQSATAYAESKILLTAAKLGIFSRIPGRINPEVFARRYKLSEQGLHLLLNALVALRIMIREDDGSYKLLGEVAALFNRYPEIVRRYKK